jgi:hypothetical protein
MRRDSGGETQPHHEDSARETCERAHRENALDEALKDTFPASDPVSIEQPAPPADRDRAKTESLKMNRLLSSV